MEKKHPWLFLDTSEINISALFIWSGLGVTGSRGSADE